MLFPVRLCFKRTGDISPGSSSTEGQNLLDTCPLNYSSPNLQGQESIDYSCLCRAAHRTNLEQKGLLKNILRNIGR